MRLHSCREGGKESWFGGFGAVWRLSSWDGYGCCKDAEISASVRSFFLFSFFYFLFSFFPFFLLFLFLFLFLLFMDMFLFLFSLSFFFFWKMLCGWKLHVKLVNKKKENGDERVQCLVLNLFFISLYIFIFCFFFFPSSM